MAGNSSRRGAVRRGSKNTAGSGGRRRKALEGKGPTPKAEDRTYHAAHRNKMLQERAASKRTGGATRPGRSSSRSNAGEVVAGRNSVLEALRAGIPATSLYVATTIDSDDRVKESIRLAAELNLNLLEASRTDLDRITDGAVHQGLALAVPPYEYADVSELLDIAARSEKPALIVALDSVTDPRNLGAVVRSVGAFGGHGVLVPARRAAGMTASAWKVSAGAASRVRVARVTNLVRALEELKRAGCFVYGLDMGGDVTLPELDVVETPVVLVVGAEGEGLSRLVRETCDHILSIPMDSATESLNASVAAGVALYEVARSRR